MQRCVERQTAYPANWKPQHTVQSIHPATNHISAASFVWRTALAWRHCEEKPQSLTHEPGGPAHLWHVWALPTSGTGPGSLESQVLPTSPRPPEAHVLCKQVGSDSTHNLYLLHVVLGTPCSTVRLWGPQQITSFTGASFFSFLHESVGCEGPGASPLGGKNFLVPLTYIQSFCRKLYCDFPATIWSLHLV